MLTCAALTSAKEGPEVWDSIWQSAEYASQAQRQARARRRLELFNLTHDQQSKPYQLDLGCGSCDNLSLLADLTSKGFLIGGDFSLPALRGARSVHSNVHKICLDVKHLPFPDQVFDVVYAFGLIEHIRNLDDVMSEMSRVLKPRAFLYLTTSNSKSVWQIKNNIIAKLGRYQFGYQRNMTESEVRKIVRTEFHVLDLFVVHSDWDMPFTRLFDMIWSVLNGQAGRYIYCICRKNGSPGNELP